MIRLYVTVAAVLALAGAIAGVGWYVSTLQVEISRLERDLAAQRALRATENAAREKQARRAIDTVLRQEREQRDQWERAYVELQGDRDRLAGDLSGAISRLRAVRSPAPRTTAACSDRVPETAAATADAGDPIGLSLALGEALYRLAAEADAAAVQARIERAWIRAVSDGAAAQEP